MLERAREVTRNGKYTYIEYARFADDLVILIDAYKRHDWLVGAVDKRLREEFGKLQVEINDEKSRTVDLERGECFGFLGFEFRYLRGLSGAMRPHYTPKLKKRTALVRVALESMLGVLGLKILLIEDDAATARTLALRTPVDRANQRFGNVSRISAKLLPTPSQPASPPSLTIVSAKQPARGSKYA